MLCGDLIGKEIQKKSGYVYTYSLVILLYSKNQQNIVNNYTPIKFNFLKREPSCVVCFLVQGIL